MMRKFLSLLALLVSLASCGQSPERNYVQAEVQVDPMAVDSFTMRNAEIREDLLQQLALHDIEFWINADGSIGFYVKDTKEVDRLANEAIGVYISLQ